VRAFQYTVLAHARERIIVSGAGRKAVWILALRAAAIKKYDGLKHSGDFSNAWHLAHLLRLGILPIGYL
jgi:transposase